MSETRYVSKEYARIAQDLIATEPELEHLEDCPFTIVYLGSDATPTSNGRIIHGKCEKVPDKFKWGVPADVTITIYDGNVDGFTPQQLRILIFHELLHVGITPDGEPCLNPHDTEDFAVILDRFGAHWSEPKPDDLPF